jgi:hypothetical protein
MSSFSDPAGRRFVTGLCGSLIFVTVDIVLYLLRLPGYEVLFCIFIVYVIWVYIRFLNERKQPIDYVPWYSSRIKLGLLCGSLALLVGLFGLVLGDSDLYLNFFIAPVFFIGAMASHYKESREKSLPPADEE